MKYQLKHVAIAVVSTSLSCAALAGGDKYEHDMSMSKSDQPTFSTLDTDSDGMVSKTEISQAKDSNTEKLTEKWNDLDTNQDGKLDRAEFARFEPVSEGSSGMETDRSSKMQSDTESHMQSDTESGMQSDAGVDPYEEEKH
jgi:hypothetical protein